MRRLFIFISLTSLVVGAFIVFTLTDVRERIRERYPSAAVIIHEGHSPGVHPILSLFRLLRGKYFVPVSECISVQLDSEIKPVDFTALFQFQVASIRILRCKVNDLTPLIQRTPQVFVEFVACDLSSVPFAQLATLQTTPENPERFTYGTP